jgi:hypothetical protein
MTIHETDLHNDEYSCTYCAEDNKLRLYCGRVHRDTYNHLRNNGFKATPKQDCDFVATWSVSAEDICFAMIPEDRDIEDEDYSPEERAADRAERFAGYRDNRRTEAGDHRDTYTTGPQAFGFQSQARADKAAARHERHRDRALCQWSKAEYWQTRTAGVISHALHKSDPRTRRGRILTLEAELRKEEAGRDESIARHAGWKAISTMEGADVLLPLNESGYVDAEKMNTAQKIAYRLANCGYSYSGFSREEEAANQQFRETHRREPAFSTYDLLTADTFIRIPVRRLTPREVAVKYLEKYIDPRDPSTGKNRYIEHLNNRLIYENAMLENEGGRVSDADMAVGGWINGGSTGTWLEDNPGGWQQILKVSKSPKTKRVTSVKVLGVYRSAVDGNRPGLVTINVERMAADRYRPPGEGDKRKALETLASMKTPTSEAQLINPTKEDAQKLQDRWNAAALATGKTTKKVEVREITQEEFSRHLKHEYVFIRGVKLGNTIVKLRLARGGGYYDYHAALQVIVLTDKPQKPLPAFDETAAEEAEPEAAPEPVHEPAEPSPAGLLF